MLNFCPSQKEFIKQSVGQSIRIDGRSNEMKRSPVVKTNVIAHLPGSSYVYLEYENVEIYTGIKIKIEQVIPNCENNQVALEFTSMRKLKDHENDQMLTMQSILQQRFILQLSQSPEISHFLSIMGAKKHKLIMYIDVFFLTCPHISQLELVVTGIKAALLSTTINEIEVAYNEVTDEETTELSRNEIKFIKNQWEELHIIGGVSNSSGEHFVVDMRPEEYESMDCCFLVSTSSSKVIHLETLKGTTSIDSMNRCARFASTNGNHGK